jgi:hypothetical protein
MTADLSLRALRLARVFPVVAAVTACAFAGCASTTTLQTQPPGAQVKIDGVPVGTTPYSLTDTKIVGSNTQLRFELAGYQPYEVTLQRNEEVDVLPLIGGFFVLVPWLWVFKYKPTHTYVLQPAGAGAPAPAAPPPGYPPPEPAPGPAGYPTQPR